MVEVLLADLMVFHDVVNSEHYDLLVGLGYASDEQSFIYSHCATTSNRTTTSTTGYADTALRGPGRSPLWC